MDRALAESTREALGLTGFSQFYFRHFPGAIRSEQIIEFLGALKRQIKRPLLIIWDGAAIHRSRKLNAWLEELNGHIAVARPPPYVPELNPVETIWAYLQEARDFSQKVLDGVI